jgi:hypothetical protein
MKKTMNRAALMATVGIVGLFCCCCNDNKPFPQPEPEPQPASPGTVKLYARPEGLAENVVGIDHTVWVNGRTCPVYRTEATGGGVEYGQVFPEYVYFDFDKTGPVSIVVKTAYTPSNVEVQPSRAGITPIADGNMISFEIDRPGQYFVKTGGDHSNGNTADRNLYIFANPPEENVPSKDDPDVVWFEPGVYSHKEYRLESNKTYYIEGGAFVYGRFYGSRLENVTIRGRGTLCGEFLTDMYDPGRTVCIDTASDNIRLEGINIMHPKVWSVAFYQSSNIHIDNIHVIAHGQSSDGCDITGCREVLVENSFFRGHDDILAVKARDFRGTMAEPRDCENVTFRDCVIWSDSSNPMTIGYETNQNVRNILYESIDVLSMSMPPVWQLEAVMAIEPHAHNGVIGGDVDGVTYRDIRVDVAVPQNSLFRFVVGDGGAIKNITLEDVFVNYGGTLGGLVYGSAARGVENVRLTNVRNSDGVLLAENKVTANGYVTGLAISPHVAEGTSAGEVWDFSNEFGGFTTMQGGNDWYYRYIDAGEMKDLPWNAGRDRWAAGTNCYISWSRSDSPEYGENYTYFPKMTANMHPDARPVCLVWMAPAAGEISVTGKVRRYSGSGDGVDLSIRKNNAPSFYSSYIPPANNVFNSLGESRQSVEAGDRIIFTVGQRTDNSYDNTELVPVIRYESLE